MSDRVLSDILLFRQVDDAIKRESDGGEALRGALDGRKQKKIVVVKKVPTPEPSQFPDLGDSITPTKKVVVARKVKLGDTTLPPLSKVDSAGTLPQVINNSDVGTIPLSIISKAKRGPKYDTENRLVERSVLGPVDDYINWQKPATPVTPLSHKGGTTERPRTAVDADELINIMKKMTIHEKIRYLKEERALQRWEKTVAEWERIKARMASRTGRDVDRVLVARSECFREVMEQRELIERALAIKDKDEINDLFATTLKQVGQDKGLYMEMKQPRRDPIEVIGKPGNPRSRPSSSYYSSRKQELQYSLDIFSPHEPEINGLTVVGTPVGKNPPPMLSPLAALSRQLQNPSIASLSTYVHPPTNQDGWSDNNSLNTPSGYSHRGPMVLFEGASNDSNDLRVVCEVEVGGLTKAVLHAHNVGSTAVYYSWRKLGKEQVFDVKEEESDSSQRFYFHDMKGVMLPSETHSFIFGFKSDNHGIFFEKWIFESTPALSKPGPTLTLKGIAIQEDDIVEARYQLEEAIGAKQINHGVQDIIRSIIENIQPVVKPIPPIEDMDAEQELFLRQNKELHLYYTSELCEAFQTLARSTYEVLLFNEDKKWDFSVINLNEAILCISDDRLRSDYLSELNILIEQASMPRKPDQSITYCMAYDMLIQLCDHMPFISSSLREGLGLPSSTFVPAEDDVIRKLDSFGNLTDASKKQKAKDDPKRGKTGNRRGKRSDSPEKRQESPPRTKKKGEKPKEEESDKEDDRNNKSPAKKRVGRTRQKEREKPDKEGAKEKEKESEKTPLKDSMPNSRRNKKKKPDGEDDKKSEEEEEWSTERRAKEAEYKAEFTAKVRGMVLDTFSRFRRLAKEADVLANRSSQDLFFETVALAPSPIEKILEEHLPQHQHHQHQQHHHHHHHHHQLDDRERERERDRELDDQTDAQSTASYSFQRTLSTATATIEGDSESANDARARRRRRVINRK